MEINYCNFIPRDFELQNNEKYMQYKREIREKAEKIVCTLGDYTNYNETNIWQIKKVLSGLKDNSIAYQYFYFIQSNKYLCKERIYFETKIKELGNPTKEEILSIVAYSLIINQNNLKYVDKIEKVYLKEIEDHMNDKVCNRRYCKYNLNPMEFHHYKVMYAALYSDEKLIKQEIYRMLLNEYGNITDYLPTYNRLDDPDKEEINIYLPFASAWMEAYFDHAEVMRVNEILSVLYLMAEYEHVNGFGLKNVIKLLHLSYYIYGNPYLKYNFQYAEKFRKNMEKFLNVKLSEHKRKGKNPYSIFLFLNDLTISPEFKYSCSECQQIINDLSKCKQKDIDHLFTDFYAYCYYKESIEREGAVSVEDFNKGLFDIIETIADFVFDKEKDFTNKEKRRIDNYTNQWIQFFFYAQQWLNRRTWKELESNPITVKEYVTLQNSIVTNCDKELNNKIDTLQKQLEENKKFNNNVNDLYKQIAELKKENKELREKTEDAEKDKKELIGLRNYIYKNEQEDILEDIKSIEEMGRYLDTIKGVIVGGHSNYRRKLENYIPSWKKYGPSSNIPAGCISNAELIVFFTDHIDHATYLKAINEVRKFSCNLLYVHSTNIEASIKYIYDNCKEGVL